MIAPTGDRDLSRVLDQHDGWMLYELLSLAGWAISIEPTWDGDVLVTGELGRDSLTMRGSSAPVLACDFFKTAAAIAFAQEHAR